MPQACKEILEHYLEAYKRTGAEMVRKHGYNPIDPQGRTRQIGYTSAVNARSEYPEQDARRTRSEYADHEMRSEYNRGPRSEYERGAAYAKYGDSPGHAETHQPPPMHLQDIKAHKELAELVDLAHELYHIALNLELAREHGHELGRGRGRHAEMTHGAPHGPGPMHPGAGIHTGPAPGLQSIVGKPSI